MKDDLLLYDEKKITEEDFQERKLLLEEFERLPNEFVTEIRHLQPQIGCLNTCRICSKNAENKVEQWTERRVRNIVAALKYRALKVNENFPLIANGRENHRTGVVFPYLDNDIGCYAYLDRYIQLFYRELGVQTRISTIGYSRHNLKLNEMHKRINDSDFMEGVGGVRLSFTPYGKGWNENENYSRSEYIEDMAHFLKIYRNYYNQAGPGYRKMCVEIRYSPLVVNSEVWIENILNHTIICTNNYLFISCEQNIDFKVAQIINPDNHFIELDVVPIYFYQIDLNNKIDDFSLLQEFVKKTILEGVTEETKCEVYLMKNYEGEYFAINPKLTIEGNWGLNIYPCTQQRKVSGYIVTERFLLNAMFAHKKSIGISSFAKFESATWEDVDKVIDICEQTAERYQKQNKLEKYEYIINVVVPMIKGYVTALKKANYFASDFFNPEFTIDTGIICNLGRAINEFKGISNKPDEPLTPTHERNYGRKNSLMVKEGEVWRLSCGYNNSIIIQKLNLADTSKVCGQICCQYKIQLKNEDEFINGDDLNTNYWIPGQRRR